MSVHSEQEQEPSMLYNQILSGQDRDALDFLGLLQSKYSKRFGIKPTVDQWLKRNIVYRDHNGVSVLDIAVIKNKPDIVKLLLKSRLFLYDEIIESLSLALVKKYRDVCKIFLKNMSKEHLDILAIEQQITPKGRLGYTRNRDLYRQLKMLLIMP